MSGVQQIIMQGSRYVFKGGCHCSAPSCDHFGRHGEWKKYLATKILAKVASWRPTDLKRNLPEKLSKKG